MSTSAQVRDTGSAGASARLDVASLADDAARLGSARAVPTVPTVPTQPTPQAGQSVVVAPPRPAARLSLGTQALVTALVVRSCQPGALRTTLDGIGGPGSS